jgi:hypothetical protein
MARSKVEGVREASVKEVRELCKLAWVQDDTLSCGMFKARVLPDGRVLMFLVDGERANVYSSRAYAEEAHREYVEAVRQAAEHSAKRNVDLSLTLLPPIADFLRDVEAHARSLGPRLRIPAEALDGTEASCAAVDKALGRIRKANRMVPEIVTPVVAYIGQVMLPVCGGRWTTRPTTMQQRVAVYEPSEMAAWKAAWDAAAPALMEAADKAGEAAKARGGSEIKVFEARNAIIQAANREAAAVRPQPIRYDVIEVPTRGSQNEPIIVARDGRTWHPLLMVVRDMVECRPPAVLPNVHVALFGYRPRVEGGSPAT